MLRFIFVTFCLTLVLMGANSVHNTQDINRDNHDYVGRGKSTKSGAYSSEETTASFWRSQANATLFERLKKTANTNLAKNVIMFLGDGMSITTIAAARALLGQRDKKPGEETQLSFEKFPFVGLSKTYCVDRQVADSACSATAYLCGVKANEATIGVTAAVKLGYCKEMNNETNHVPSIAHLFQMKGKKTGIVTTTRITHASPAGVYAHTAHRDWEADSHMPDAKNCKDIALQLIHGETGKNLNVIFGGGRAYFIPKGQSDNDQQPGVRLDSRDLIKEWKEQKGNAKHEYVHDLPGLKGLQHDTEYVLGLFSSDHMDYNLDRNKNVQPSLAEMTVKAIRLLSQGEKGYFLFVEGGRIDQAHHATLAHKALDETIEFQKAVQAAVDITGESETLIVVTSDHAHTMTLNGYPERGNNILGIGGKGKDKLPYTTLSYANGPGEHGDGKRPDLTNADLNNPNFKYPSYVPLKDETHGGEDVAIFARGPWAHLLVGVTEQNVIAHVMKYASCVGPEGEPCGNGSANIVPSLLIPLLSLLAIAFAQRVL
ncbi:hypothetical protein PPYR_00603 [Photinus pyralis]|uniref:Alkaline phosphatase n=1 Tax=Photinus pyralis TaxID=7054 RepID=A0A1Y1JZ98_PHOPY|nr:alkaline phosphatase, tissue-nonspecific isozyme-like [Photinus pyralis]KAB0803633.1 hypothetical protein PPYR_00603 [Photinus pyralis]